MKHFKSLILICILLLNVPIVMAADSTPEVGTVSETIDAGGYVYLKIAEQDIWIAANSFSVSKGDRVQYSGGLEMRGFYSKTLDRTFESVFFVQNAGLANQDAGSMHASAMKSGSSVKKPAASSVQTPAAGEITPLTEGKTIADIFTGSAQLNGQMVSVNARVMKVSKHILGKNWITLQDGTGTEPDNKLMTTSAETPSPGDMVIARGTVRTDIDIGSGYQYKVMLEEVEYSPGY